MFSHGSGPTDPNSVSNRHCILLTCILLTCINCDIPISLGKITNSNSSNRFSDETIAHCSARSFISPSESFWSINNTAEVRKHWKVLHANNQWNSVEELAAHVSASWIKKYCSSIESICLAVQQQILLSTVDYCSVSKSQITGTVVSYSYFSCLWGLPLSLRNNYHFTNQVPPHYFTIKLHV